MSDVTISTGVLLCHKTVSTDMNRVKREKWQAPSKLIVSCKGPFVREKSDVLNHVAVNSDKSTAWCLSSDQSSSLLKNQMGLNATGLNDHLSSKSHKWFFNHEKMSIMWTTCHSKLHLPQENHSMYKAIG